MAEQEGVRAPQATSEVAARPLCFGIWSDLLTQHEKSRGGAPAVTQRLPDGQYVTTTYAALARKVRVYAELFADTTEPDQVIPLCLARGAECVAAMLGALVSGRAFCCVNPKLRLPQLETILTRLDAPIALVDGQGLLSLRGSWESGSPLLATQWYAVPGPAATRAAKRVLEELSAQAAVVVMPEESLDPRALSVLEPLPSEGEEERAVGCCLFTSGSTGEPKGVLITRSDLAARARVEVEWLGVQADDVLLSLLPFSFDVGLNQLLSAMYAGAELVIIESWLPADILGTVAARGVTGIAGVPSIWADFMVHGRAFDTAEAHRSLRFFTISGGDLSEAQHAQVPVMAPGVQVFKTYGQTEAFRIASLRPEQYAARPGSVGRALPGGRVYVVREDGSLAEPNETGEVVHTGVGTMLAYLSGEEREAKLRWNPWHGEDDPRPMAVFTGDFGHLDDEGFLFLAGRRDDLVKIQGNRVYPSEVKNLLTALPGVATAEVVAVTQAERTRLAAFVIAVEGETIDAETLRRQLQDRAPSYMLPEVLQVTDELPRTASGKPDRASLATKALEALAGKAIGIATLLCIHLPTWLG